MALWIPVAQVKVRCWAGSAGINFQSKYLLLPVSHGLVHEIFAPITVLVCRCVQLHSVSGHTAAEVQLSAYCHCKSVPCHLKNRLEAEEHRTLV